VTGAMAFGLSAVPQEIVAQRRMRHPISTRERDNRRSR